jgi:hypothetical protein
MRFSWFCPQCTLVDCGDPSHMWTLDTQLSLVVGSDLPAARTAERSPGDLVYTSSNYDEWLSGFTACMLKFLLFPMHLICKWSLLFDWKYNIGPMTNHGDMVNAIIDFDSCCCWISFRSVDIQQPNLPALTELLQNISWVAYVNVLECNGVESVQILVNGRSRPDDGQTFSRVLANICQVSQQQF